MSDDSSIFEDLERYRRNNVELAVALNDLKTEFNLVQMQLLAKNRELQRVYDENAALKQDNEQKDSQISSWRAMIVDLVTTNTNKYKEMMQKIGLVPSTNEAKKPIVPSTVKIETKTSAPTGNSDGRINVHRRERSIESPDRLADLTEESIHSQLNNSRSLPTSPETEVKSHVTSRRRVSVPPMNPELPLREIQDRLVTNGETKRKKSTIKASSMENIIDENTSMTATNGRTKRSAAPKNLSEPKLSTKLRRN